MKDNMRAIKPDELKKIQLKILDTLISFCERNNIKYWLTYGSLLGAVRHKGYIPWDDDIDIGMLRADFDRLMQEFNRQNTRYKFYCIENNKGFFYPFGKLLDTETLLYEPDINGDKLHVNIDIFAHDNAPDNKIKLSLALLKVRLLMKLRVVKRSYAVPRSYLKRKIFSAMRLFLRFFPDGYFDRRIVKTAKKYQKCRTKRVAAFSSFLNVVCEKSVFDNLVKIEFEGRECDVPAEYDKFLTLLYGDYMTLPPKEKRVTHHSFEAFYLKG